MASKVHAFRFRRAPYPTEALFSAGEAGAIFNPRPQYLHTDSTLATAITAAGNPIGGGDDLSGNSSPFTQSNDPDRPIYGIVPATGRRNEFTQTHDLSASAWDNVNAGLDDGYVGQDGEPAQLFYPLADGYTIVRQRYDELRDGETILSWTIKVKYSGWRYIVLRVENRSAGTNYCTYDMLNGTLVWEAATGIAVFSVEGDFFRIGVRNNIGTTYGGGDISLVLSDVAVTSGGSPSSLGIYATKDGKAGVIASSPQLEIGERETPYQRVRNQYDVTEVGVRSIHGAHFNNVNAFLANSFPAGSYTIAIAGTKGAWFDTVTHAGGTFNFGPTTYTEGPDGILEVLGDILTMVSVEGTLTATEKARLKAYFKSLGSPGVYELGSELVTNGTFDTDVSGWAPQSGASLASVSSEMVITPDGTGAQGGTQAMSALDVDSEYLIEGDVRRISGTGSASLNVTNNGVTAFVVSGDAVTASTAATQRHIFTPTETNNRVYLRVIGGSDGGFDNISVRKLELVT